MVHLIANSEKLLQAATAKERRPSFKEGDGDREELRSIRTREVMSSQRGAASIERRRSREGARRVWYGKLGGTLVSPRARFAVLVGFVLLVAFTGGGSRPDIQSLLILRPASILAATYALFAMTADQFRETRGPLLIVLSLMLLALLQLVPLPASVWTTLPNRDIVADASALIGLDGLARPISLDPDRTWNTFFALFVPLGAMSLAAVQAPGRRRLIVPLLIGIGLLSAILGFLQAIGGSGLHLYRITHSAFPVGFFANKNHQSVMLLWVMLAASWFATTVDPHRRSANGAVGGALGIILVLFPLLVLTGSRAGLLLSLPALLLIAWLLLRAPAMRDVLRKAGRKARLVVGAVLGVLFLPLLLVFGVLAASNRMTALSRLFTAEAVEDVRWLYLPVFERMALDFMPIGSGFGSFEKAFNLYEPSDLLDSRYMNQAHNDLMQFAIEGGLPALAILIVALLWLVHALWRVWSAGGSSGRNLAVFCGGSIFLWLAASLVDYPLRTPLAAMLVATLTAWLSMLSRQPPPGREPAKQTMNARRSDGDEGLGLASRSFDVRD